MRTLVLLPSFNSGSLLAGTTAAVLDQCPDVWVVIDGSTDSSADAVRAMETHHPALRVMLLPRNLGKGGAVEAALRVAAGEGFTHALVMDADGQHPASSIPEFFAISEAHPEAMILGVPVFGDDAPRERVGGRKVGNFFAELETLGGGIRDSLFGFRLYPIAPFLGVMQKIRGGRRFDFDTIVAVRLFWEGLRPINRNVPVFYPRREAGGVTHFHYLRDNLLLVRTHIRLVLLMLPRLLRIWKLSRKWRTL